MREVSSTSPASSSYPSEAKPKRAAFQGGSDLLADTWQLPNGSQEIVAFGLILLNLKFYKQIVIDYLLIGNWGKRKSWITSRFCPQKRPNSNPGKLPRSPASPLGWSANSWAQADPVRPGGPPPTSRRPMGRQTVSHGPIRGRVAAEGYKEARQRPPSIRSEFTAEAVTPLNITLLYSSSSNFEVSDFKRE